MIDENLISKCRVKDISEIDLKNIFLHYTNISNLSNIIENGLEPRIGENAKVIEKTKKVFFTMGDKGALVIMDVWLKWLIAKPVNNYIYWIGAFLLNIPFFPKFIHKMIIDFNNKNKNKHYWAYNRLKKILDNSIYLILDLKENEDFSFTDIDEVKKLSKFPIEYMKKLYSYDSDVNDFEMEYWNMHTYSNKIIEKDKISILKINNNYSASDALIYMANKNKQFIIDNCPFLFGYLKFYNIQF